MYWVELDNTQNKSMVVLKRRREAAEQVRGLRARRSVEETALLEDFLEEEMDQTSKLIEYDKKHVYDIPRLLSSSSSQGLLLRSNGDKVGIYTLL